MPALVLIEQQFGSYFKFWFNDQLCEGMCYGNELFRQFRTFSAHRRAHAYSVGCALTQQGVAVVMTCTSDRNSSPEQQQYILWISLRAVWSEVETLVAPTVTPNLAMNRTGMA